MPHTFFSQRAGLNPHPSGLPLNAIIDLFTRVYNQRFEEGYFAEAFGYTCVDAGDVPGKIREPELEILLSVRKGNLWPIHTRGAKYTEDDLFDIIEFLFMHVSKPTDGTYHSYNDCGMHWSRFDKLVGEKDYRSRINSVLSHYEKKFGLSPSGEVLTKADHGFEQIFKANIPTSERNVVGRMEAAIVKFRRHGASLDDRRQAVRDLADVLEYLRPKMGAAITDKDEGALFNIANNFGIRHHNDKQQTGYDAAIWLSWMFYFYLATIHVILRKTEPLGNVANSVSKVERAVTSRPAQTKPG